MLIRGRKSLESHFFNATENNIFVATYWSDVLKLVKKDSLEYRFVNNLVPIPVDQRIEQKDLFLIIRNIEKYL